MHRKRSNNFSSAFYAVSLGLQLGLIIATPIGLCMLAGLWIDKRFGSSPFFLMMGVIGGIAIAYRETVNMIKPLIRK